MGAARTSASWLARLTALSPARSARLRPAPPGVQVSVSSLPCFPQVNTIPPRGVRTPFPGEGVSLSSMISPGLGAHAAQLLVFVLSALPCSSLPVASPWFIWCGSSASELYKRECALYS